MSFRSPLHVLQPRRSLTALFLGTAAMSSYSISSTQTEYSVRNYTVRHKEWPYTKRDFQRDDSFPDSQFYSTPKFVTHIDDNAIEALAKYYDGVLPKTGKILDFCSSWVSHYPARISAAVEKGDLEVWGMGLNGAELARNTIFGPVPAEGKDNGRRIVKDLNVPVNGPDDAISSVFPQKDMQFDAMTCTVSIDYLSDPLSVLGQLRSQMNQVKGGTIHLAISNRAFWHKVIRRWKEVNEKERLLMVCDYLHFAGWEDIEVVTVVPGGQGGDPLWVVRGRTRA